MLIDAAVVKYFDEDGHSVSLLPLLSRGGRYADFMSIQTGSLTAKLSDNPQKISGLAGITLGA